MVHLECVEIRFEWCGVLCPGLAILLPYLLSRHQIWKNCKLRIFTGASSRGIDKAKLRYNIMCRTTLYTITYSWHYIRVHFYIITVYTVGHSPRVQCRVSWVEIPPREAIFSSEKIVFLQVWLCCLPLLYLDLVNDTQTMNYIILVFTHETWTSTLV